MRKLFSGNADVVAVFAVVLTLGLLLESVTEFSRAREVRDRVLTRIPARVQRDTGQTAADSG